MNTKTMTGLVGANVSMKLAETPMSLYRKEYDKKEPDVELMNRCAGYAEDMTKQAQDYDTKVKEGMDEEAEETRENQKAEAEKQAKEIKSDIDSKTAKTAAKAIEDIQNELVDISQEGLELSDNDSETEPVTGEKAVLYTKSGKKIESTTANKGKVSGSM